MKVYVGQIYIEPDTYYPFSHHFQRLIHEELTKRLEPSAVFIDKYGADFKLMFNMSAKASIARPEVRGPSVFRKTKDVEFTIFLTFDRHAEKSNELYRGVLSQLFDQILGVLKTLEMDVSRLSADADDIIQRLLDNPLTLKKA